MKWNLMRLENVEGEHVGEKENQSLYKQLSRQKTEKGSWSNVQGFLF